MKVNFFETECKEATRTAVEFGICDDDNGEKAYTNITDRNRWIAIVKNNKQRTISFTPIDNCINISKEGTNNQESTCDGMLTYEENIYLIELKNQKANWINKAIQQLESTIRIILNHHDLNQFKYKKAFACNKNHPKFATISNERNKRFFKEYGFRIDVQGTINIK
ncbi:MAG: hypothetical protein AB8G86_23230 [Saprospiraceae bacterium]